ncbi:pullulanase-type alpha-1,6-glucosidase [Luteimonas sp. WGS1318]|uniref:pullulanase-type alpha-1,6-glucosidase n=1 Tax=Luteimonas sp. WGS1318 TaxID=3366815 RepID=UPI00372CF47E
MIDASAPRAARSGLRALTLAVAAFACGAAIASPPQRDDCDAPAFARTLHPVPADAPVHAARAHWLNRHLIRWPGAAPATDTRFRLYHAANATLDVRAGRPVAGFDRALDAVPHTAALPAPLAARFAFVDPGATLTIDADDAMLASLHRGQLLLVHEDARGHVLDATALQVAGAFDDLYASAVDAPVLGAVLDTDATRFHLWAPSAQAVALCLYPDADAGAGPLAALERDAATGAWHGRLPGDHGGDGYLYLVDVFVPGTGIVRNRVTDPYSVALDADSRRSIVLDLDAPALKPEGWDTHAVPTLGPTTNMVAYELHVRDFSRDDQRVPEAQRGRYTAFEAQDSHGVRHLRRLRAAGVTDVHLLPVFDLATVPETGCITPEVPDAAPDSTAQQAAVMAVAARDCFNWGYDPLHFNVPEGSYASDAADPAARILEFRRMVQALHGLGLRVGMDVVYNHTSASGQHPQSVLDRIVPGYYHRLDADGRVETSTCCDNTATEHAMMARLMIDSAALWVRHYRIDSFRFDLMGHQPRDAMRALQARVDAEAGRPVPLMGEGWNFGEVAGDARFVQATQARLGGTGIATFSDRARDAVRGGGPSDRGDALRGQRGWIHGHDDDALLRRQADLVRVGLAGTLRDYRMTMHDGVERPLSAIDYAGQPAGYAAAPGEVVNYVENHDNHTLFDVGVLRLPDDADSTARVHAQVLALATTAFSQGIAYLHAGVELMRSKSLDRNSYDSGDWFNRIDWSGDTHGFGHGLPPAPDNAADWPQLQPLLADAARIRPPREAVMQARDMSLDLLRIRASTPLFRLERADDVQARLRFPGSGADSDPRLVAGHLDGRGLDDAGFRDVLYAINVADEARTLDAPELAGRGWRLHPVHLAADAADPRPRDASRIDDEAGRFTVPPRTALVFVVP